MNPVLAPAQTALEGTYGLAFSHSPVLPSGFESGAVLALSGSSAFELENGNIVPAAAGGPDAGDYELVLEMTHGDLLGTVTLTVTANIARAELAEGDYGLAGLTPESAIAVAAGYVGSVYAVALSDDATDGVIQLPDDLTSDEFELALSSDFRTAELRLTAVAEGRDVAGAFTLTVARQSEGAADANYAPLAQTLFATVSALPAPALQEVSGDELFDVNADLRAALGEAYASANFGKESGADELAVSEEGVVSATGLSAGNYGVVVTATASAFLGTARVTVSARVAAVPIAARFYGSDFRRAGETAAIAASAHPLAAYIPRPLQAEFLGARRGLTLAAIHEAPSGDAAFGALDANDFAALRRACSDGGTGWRLPNFSEVAGMLSPAGTSAQVRQSGSVRIPGVDSETVAVNFPATAESDASALTPSAKGFNGVVADFAILGDDILLAPLNLSGEGVAVLASQNALRLVCVLPADGYAVPAEPAGILANGKAVENGAATITLEAAHNLPADENYGTLTLAAWRFNDAGETIAAADGAISHSVGAEASADETTGAGGIALGLRPASDESVTVEVAVNPAIGRTVTIHAALLRLPPPQRAGFVFAHSGGRFRRGFDGGGSRLRRDRAGRRRFDIHRNARRGLACRLLDGRQ